jgi:hypothetical protein
VTVIADGAAPPPVEADESSVGSRLRAQFVIAGASVAIGAIAGLVFFHFHVARLPAATDIVGYPIFANFDVYRYFDVYDAILAVPVVSAVAYLALDGLARKLGPLRSLPPIWPVTSWWPGGLPGAAEPLAGWWWEAFRVAVTAGVVAVIVAIDRDWHSSFWPRAAGVLLVTSMAIVAGGWLLHRATLQRHRTALESVSTVNAYAAALLMLGLLVASSATQVSVTSDGAVHRFGWMPMWLGILLTLAAIVAVWEASRVGPFVAERRALLLVAVPVALLLVSARVVTFTPIPSWAFESGQYLASQQFLTASAVPWKDFLDAHGLLGDALLPLMSVSLVQNSLWGLVNGYTLLLDPLCLVATYYLLARVFNGNLVFLAASTFLLLNTQALLIEERFIFWPLILVLLAATLDRPGRLRPLLLGASLTAQAIVTPEAAYCVAAAGSAILFFDLYHWRRRASMSVNFRLTFWTTVGGAGCAGVVAAYLISQGALAAFVNYYAVFVPGHALAGGIPISTLSQSAAQLMIPSGETVFWVAAPIVSVGLAIVFLTARLALRRPLLTVDWVMLAAAVMTALYYTKFLGRADLHVEQAYAMTVPLLFVLAFRVTGSLDLGFRAVVRRARMVRLERLRPVSIVALIVCVGIVSGGITAKLDDAPGNFRTVVASEPSVAQIGYVSDFTPGPAALASLRRVLAAYLHPGAALFDFSNSPGLYYYLLGYRPGTIYYNVSIAQTQASQVQLIDQLEASRPSLVAMFSGENGGLPEWDTIPNSIRHYEVGEYLLDHYHPFFSVGGSVVYAANDLHLPSPQSLGLSVDAIDPTSLYFTGPACWFGDIPSRLQVVLPPASGASPIQLSIDRGSASTLISPPPGSQWSDYEWIEINVPRMSAGDWALNPPGQSDLAHQVTFSTLSTSPTSYRIPIGSCTQWHGYPGMGPLALTTPPGQQITDVRLLP